MAREVYIDDQSFRLGLQALDDTTKAPFGAALVMENCMITDKGGIAPRLGTSLLGTVNSSTFPVRSIYTFKKSFGTDEFLIKTYDTKIEVYSRNNSTSGWFLLKSGFTSDKEFGFLTSLVNTSSQDYTIFCNRYEPYQSWTGATTLLNGVLVGAETVITVDSVLTPEVFDAQVTASVSGSSATTLTLSTSPAPWAASQWNNFYVYIKTGVNAGKISLISATTSSAITFATLGSDPGSCDFEIRQAMFPASGNLIIGSSVVTYTAIPTATTFTVSSAPAATNRSIVATTPVTYLDAPRGNRLTNLLNRIIVGNVRSALARTSGGALSGFSPAGSYFVSKINNPFDFGFAATRVAGEGDIVSTPYGGGDITDVVTQEDSAYIFKQRYVEDVKYTQDTSDLAQRTPLKAEIGSVNRVIKGADDVYFMTPDKKFTSIGREKLKDVLPQTENMGYIIKRLLDSYTVDSFVGTEFADRIYFACKTTSAVTANDIVVVYNKNSKSFEGTWTLSVNGFVRFNNLLHFADSTSANVYQMLTGHADVSGTDRFPIVAKYQSHFANLGPIFRRLKRRQISSFADRQAIHSMYFEGYIKGATNITFQVWKDFATTPFLQFNFSGAETTFQDGANLIATLGDEEIGLAPMGSISAPDVDGYRHFQFRVYFPFVYGNYFSVGHQSQNVDDDYEISRYGLGMLQDVSADMGRIKSIN